MRPDQKTADAFAKSWTNLPVGSVYTEDQVIDWFLPLSRSDFVGRRVLEMGCGNGSLMMHVLGWKPKWILGIDLGDSVSAARTNLVRSGFENWEIVQSDITTFESPGFDIVYCIGVLHHLKDPRKGFDAVVRNVTSGGRFHCWVYAWEGNGIIRWIVDPIRRVASKLPWWVTKYLVATPLVFPYFLYAKLLALLPEWGFLESAPLYKYSRWIAKREFGFFRHVAFDQLVTPQTAYIRRKTIERWLDEAVRVDPQSTYILMRNGNSWKFGGRLL